MAILALWDDLLLVSMKLRCFKLALLVHDRAQLVATIYDTRVHGWLPIAGPQLVSHVRDALGEAGFGGLRASHAFALFPRVVLRDSESLLRYYLNPSDCFFHFHVARNLYG